MYHKVYQCLTSLYMPRMVLTICLSSGRADHGRPEGGAQTQEGQPGAGVIGNVQQPVSTGQGSLEQGGEGEHMEQVCGCKAWLMSCRLMQVSTPGELGHTEVATHLSIEICRKSLAHWCNCFQLPVQSSKRRRTTGMSGSEVNKVDR